MDIQLRNGCGMEADTALQLCVWALWRSSSGQPELLLKHAKTMRAQYFVLKILCKITRTNYR
jgi:hypothetical protein